MTKARKAFKQWLVDEKALSQNENVFHAEKAFLANSIFIWYLKQSKAKVFDEKQIRQCMHILRNFLKGKLDIYWENGILKTQDKKSHKKGDSDERSGMENTNKQ